VALSLDAFTRALAPFTPTPDDLLHPERLAGKIAEWLNPSRLVAKAAASGFHLQPGGLDTFDDWWALARPARDLLAEGHKRDGSGVIDVELRRAFTRLAAMVNDGARHDDLGYRFLARLPDSKPLVIFSDHHMGCAGNRQDFFTGSGNRELYAEILDEYADAGFTLVENGDVEELIVHEPDDPRPTRQLALLDAVQDPTNIRDDGWEPIDALRRSQRLGQLSKVIDTHRALYDQINRQFVETGRYVRIAGNHDQDLQDPAFLAVLRRVYPRLDRVQDFLVVDDGRTPRFIVGHGHHFDTSGTPKFSRRAGETLSECLAWAYEGADRVWRWDGLDGVQKWCDGREPFRNTLVTDDTDRGWFSFRDGLEAGLAAWLGSATAGMVGLGPLGGVGAMAAALADQLSNPGFWESVFGHNIAWEYFRSDDPGEALFNEMFAGKRWMKVRHLDEIFIAGELRSAFGDEVPALVLGHSHEVRHEAWNPATRSTTGHYLNSGAAGRFENLIWCVEIVDGQARIVAWHRPGGPRTAQAPERRIYTPRVRNGAGELVASETAIPLDSPRERRAWLAAVLPVMFAETADA
jgi:hypothetical protein